MKNYRVIAVANGWIVIPGEADNDPTRYTPIDWSRVRVFYEAADLAAWMDVREQYKAELE